MLSLVSLIIFAIYWIMVVEANETIRTAKRKENFRYDWERVQAALLFRCLRTCNYCLSVSREEHPFLLIFIVLLPTRSWRNELRRWAAIFCAEHLFRLIEAWSRKTRSVHFARRSVQRLPRYYLPGARMAKLPRCSHGKGEIAKRLCNRRPLAFSLQIVEDFFRIL